MSDSFSPPEFSAGCIIKWCIIDDLDKQHDTTLSHHSYQNSKIENVRWLLEKIFPFMFYGPGLHCLDSTDSHDCVGCHQIVCDRK